MKPYNPTSTRWKTCVDCGKRRERLISFRPRFTRCLAHREARQPRDESCRDCREIIWSNIRQPRCIECDLQRDRRGIATRVRSRRRSAS